MTFLQAEGERKIKRREKMVDEKDKNLIGRMDKENEENRAKDENKHVTFPPSLVREKVSGNATEGRERRR